mgnify:FL=1
MIGERIKKIRLKKGLNQVDIYSKIGLSSSYYSEIENGKKNVTIETLEKICKVLGLSLSEFFSDDTEKIVVDNEIIKIIKDSRVTPAQLRKALKLIDVLESNQD